MKRNADQIRDKLIEQLETAIMLEHATIPPYLYAFWSIKDLESPLALSISEVIKEEMLHMALACNILNAIGGVPNFSRPEFVIDYPTALPAHDMMQDPFIVGLNKLDVNAAITFLHIELPRDLGVDTESEETVDTIGEFYAGIRENINLLPRSYFKYGKQLDARFAPFKSGVLFQINSREDALRAVEEIIEQGEGLSAESPRFDEEEDHFHRFLEIYREMGGEGEIVKGSFDAANLASSLNEETYSLFQSQIKNVIADPKKNNAQSASAYFQNKRFNSAYSKMLDALTEGFNLPEPDITRALQHMFALTRPALEIMSVPVDSKDLTKGYCGPTFEYLLPEERLS